MDIVLNIIRSMIVIRKMNYVNLVKGINFIYFIRYVSKF